MLDPGRPFLISPPFGTWFRADNAYSILGSFTVEPRPGRLGQVLRTVRPAPFERGPAWINKIGLRNPGMNSLPRYKRRDADGPFRENEIVSLAPLADTDWHAIERWLDERFGLARVEINVSCPNVDEHPRLPDVSILRRLVGSCPSVIFKLPPTSSANTILTIDRLIAARVRYVHLSNTLPSPIGGISGAPLREVNLPLVESVARTFGPQIEVVAGGGIYTAEDVRRYQNAGASRFSIATAFFKPWRAHRVLRIAEQMVKKVNYGAP